MCLCYAWLFSDGILVQQSMGCMRPSARLTCQLSGYYCRAAPSQTHGVFTLSGAVSFHCRWQFPAHISRGALIRHRQWSSCLERAQDQALGVEMPRRTHPCTMQQGVAISTYHFCS